jgi:hypothetical protein
MALRPFVLHLYYHRSAWKSLGLRQDKGEGGWGRLLGVRQMAAEVFGAETAGGTVAQGEPEGAGRRPIASSTRLPR